MSYRFRFLAVLVLLSAIPLWSGCGPGNKLGREAVSGTVTFNGNPLPEGSIMFEPISGRGAMGGGRIENGSYQLSVQGGLPPGEYRVRISAAATGPNAGAAGGPPEKLPAWRLIVRR